VPGKYGDILEDYQDEALRIVRAAEDNGIPLRIVGCLAFRIKCPEFVELHKSMDRVVTDIDFVGYYKHHRKVINLFRDDLGYKWVPPGFARASTLRDLFVNPSTGFKIDVFYDHLDFCHLIRFDKDKRLDVDSPTIPLAELFLEKTQIVEINAKDFKDLVILFLKYDVSQDDDDSMINGKRIAKILSDDWGFYYTVTTNMDKFLEFVKGLDKIDDEQRDLIVSRVTKLRQLIEDEPKSRGWKRRAKIGTKKRWYKIVHTMDEITRAE